MQISDLSIYQYNQSYCIDHY